MHAAPSQPVTKHVRGLLTCERGAAQAKSNLSSLHLCHQEQSSSCHSVQLLTVVLADLIATSELL